jgi:nitroimidazol reductase NimA-like FMN-containing flavoprotein (pyridoxamine 5'-phosphate oxidase superfamily)
VAIIDSKTWMEHLRPEECWELLAGTPVGRIGVLVDSAPEIYPVNHVVDGQTVVFRTERGQKLRGLDRSPSVCFEVDGYDATTSTGWSVLVKGRAREVTAAEEERRLLGLDLKYWSVGLKPRWIRIEPSEVTGRRILRPEGREHP